MPETTRVTHLPHRCDECAMAWRTLFDVLTNGMGWRRLCGGCANPRDSGAPRAYLGPYPITIHSRRLHLVSEDART